MNVKDSLNQALKDAMKAEDDVAKRTLRMVRAAIKNAEIDGGRPLEEDEVLRILQKEVKSRRETIAEAQKIGRSDIIEDAQAEIAVLERFLPQTLSSDGLEAIVRAAITEAGATSLADMGKVMRLVMPKVQGQADGRQVNEIVRHLLGKA